jgi:hypothetical protein
MGVGIWTGWEREERIKGKVTCLRSTDDACLFAGTCSGTRASNKKIGSRWIDCEFATIAVDGRIFYSASNLSQWL